MTKLLQWFKKWLRLDSLECTVENNGTTLLMALEEIGTLKRQNKYLESAILSLNTEVAKLQVERYVPPIQEIPKPKLIVTKTFREFTDIVEGMREAEEERNAV